MPRSENEPSASARWSLALRSFRDRGPKLRFDQHLARPHHLMPDINRPSPVIRKQLDGGVEAAQRIFADALKLKIVFDEIGKGVRQQHVLPQLLGERLQA